MKRDKPQLLVANSKAKIYSLPYLEAAGMKCGKFFRLAPKELIRLPRESRLFILPDRLPVGYDSDTNGFVVLDKGTLTKKNERCFAVSAFISPGFTVTYNSSYRELKKAAVLPLFSYAAVAFYKGEFYVAALRVDREPRHDPRFIDIDIVREKSAELKKIFSHNRLITHLEKCALTYGCPGAQNFFLSRYEGPLPVSPYCNASCRGCISYQAEKKPRETQPRIKFIPTAEEVSEVAIFHMQHVDDPVVSFGQGCEGEPLIVAGVIEQAIRLIRKNTRKGIINMNTNASKPRILAKLFDAGLDSIRVSLNSARKQYYTRYYKPRGYGFEDVAESIRMAKQRKAFVSLNYLTMPGFTDRIDEFAALKKFIETLRIDMIQWRNLNFDPLRYFDELKVAVGDSELLGIREVIKSIKNSFPDIMTGYYNPSKLKMRRGLTEKS